MAIILDDKEFSSYTNLNTTIVPDQHNPDGGGEANGTTSRLNKSGVLVSGVTDFSFAFWLFMTSTPASDAWPISQLDSGGLQGFFFDILNDGKWSVDARTSNTERTTSRATNVINNSTWNLIGCSVRRNTVGVADADVDLFFNGAGATEDLSSDHAGGTGWQNVTATAAAQQISLLSGQHFSRPLPSGAIFSRPFMRDTYMSLADHTAHFTAEVAAFGEGLKLPIRNRSSFVRGLRR